MKKSEFEQRCYEAYQLDWMLKHGHSLQEYLEELAAKDDEDRTYGTYPEGNSEEVLNELANRWEDETGFGGSIWACKDEFLGAEFQDEAYMEHLFSMMPNSKEMEDFWRVFYSHSKTVEPAIVLPLKEGRLEAFVSIDPDYPGIDIEYVSDAEDELENEIYNRPRIVIEAPINPETQEHNTLRALIWDESDSPSEDYSTKIEFSCAEDILRREKEA